MADAVTTCARSSSSDTSAGKLALCTHTHPLVHTRIHSTYSIVHSTHHVSATGTVYHLARPEYLPHTHPRLETTWTVLVNNTTCLLSAMNPFICNLCPKSSKQKYHDKTSDTGTYTDLGGKLHACTGFTVPSNLKAVCKQCRDAIIQVRKMQMNLVQWVLDLRNKIQSVSITTPVSTSKRSCSPMSSSTGLSPAAKTTPSTCCL